MKFEILKYSLFFVLFLASGCFTPIKLIVENPDYYDAKKVKIKGKVISSIELDDLNIFYIQNGKNTIAVITEGYLPIKNEVVKVKGQVYSNFQYHSRWNMQVVYERIKIHNKKTKKADYKYINKKYFDPDDF